MAGDGNPSRAAIGYAAAVNGNGYRAVSFDVGGTMIYCDPSPGEIYAHHLSRHGRPVRAEDVSPVFRDAWAEMQRRNDPGRDRYNSMPGGERAWWGRFVREVLQRLDHDASWEPLLDDLYAAFSDSSVWRVYPETARALQALAARGLRLAVISNWDRRLPQILRSLNLYEIFSTVTVSSIEGREKPAPEIFHGTVDRLEVTPSETLHVGDSPLEDYGGAENAGLGAALIDRHGLFAGEPYRRISSLDEILTLLEG